MEGKNFQDILKEKMNSYVHLVYDLSKNFPSEELYGVTSQIRRASLSVILNYIEGYARQQDRNFINFLDISYGSLKESKYLLYFSYKRNYLPEDKYRTDVAIAEKIGKMLWRCLDAKRNNV